MIRTALFTCAIAVAPLSAAAAQQSIAGTRLDIVATGEVTRVPDIVRIGTGVVTTAPTASAAIAQNAQRMASVRAALKRAGIADRDIQTSALSLHPEHRHDNTGRAPTLIGYRASNEVSVRFRDIANTGKIIDALVAQGANQINGPMLSIEKPEAALDEARGAALQKARARAEMYARTLGKRVGRIVSVSEAGGQFRPMPMMRQAADALEVSGTSIDAGEQSLSVSLTVTFELE
jgi:uncharacterized protein YggE